MKPDRQLALVSADSSTISSQSITPAIMDACHIIGESAT